MTVAVNRYHSRNIFAMEIDEPKWKFPILSLQCEKKTQFGLDLGLLN